MTMTASEFVAIVRKGSDKLRIDNLVLNAGELEIHGKGVMRISQEGIVADMVLDPGKEPPESRTGVFTKSDYWKLGGVIEDCLGFRCEYVSPAAPSRFCSWGVDKTTLSFELNPIDLLITGWDAMTSEERNRQRKQIQANSAVKEPNCSAGQDPPKSQCVNPTSQFIARLANFSLPTLLCKGTERMEVSPYFGRRSSGRLDTIVGEIQGYNFALIQEQDAPDVTVYLDSQGGYSSSDEDWKRFHAFMSALAFTLGKHAWPYRTEYWRDGRKLADSITQPRRLPHTVHTPFRLHDFDFQDVIKKATAFFEGNSALSQEVSHILFLFRQAADSELVHGEITLLATCVLFESLVNQIFKGLGLQEKVLARDVNIGLFTDAKTEVCKYILEQAATKGEGYKRLHNYVHSAQPASFLQKLRAVVSWFGLKWEGDMEPVYRVWQDVRHPTVHGGDRTGQSEAQLKSSMLAESRIAGALNMLVLKLIGYSGPMSSSAFEAQYRRV